MELPINDPSFRRALVEAARGSVIGQKIHDAVEKVGGKTMARFECDRCAACCRHLIIEVQHIDVVREPRLFPLVVLLDGYGKIKHQSDWEKEYYLAAGNACPMLGADNLCTCYPSRPNVCVAMQPGDECCQHARHLAGLPPLLPQEE